jgi:hypothetical protein
MQLTPSENKLETPGEQGGKDNTKENKRKTGKPNVFLYENRPEGRRASCLHTPRFHKSYSQQ